MVKKLAESLGISVQDGIGLVMKHASAFQDDLATLKPDPKLAQRKAAEEAKRLQELGLSTDEAIIFGMATQKFSSAQIMVELNMPAIVAKRPGQTKLSIHQIKEIFQAKKEEVYGIDKPLTTENLSASMGSPAGNDLEEPDA